MSGLVSGLQNRVRRFESARNLGVIENKELKVDNDRFADCLICDFKLNGSLDERLSQRSAKPCTAVRIRQEPHKTLVTN